MQKKKKQEIRSTVTTNGAQIGRNEMKAKWVTPARLGDVVDGGGDHYITFVEVTQHGVPVLDATYQELHDLVPEDIEHSGEIRRAILAAYDDVHEVAGVLECQTVMMEDDVGGYHIIFGRCPVSRCLKATWSTVTAEDAPVEGGGIDYFVHVTKPWVRP